MSSEPTAKAPGWYADPRDETHIRYWDGERWTDQRRRRPGWAGGPRTAQELTRVRRRVFFIVASVGFLLAAALSLAIIDAGEDDVPARTVDDRTFTEQANAICKEKMPALRAARPQPGARQDPGTLAEVASNVEATADGLEKVAGELRALPVAAGDEDDVRGWLEDWEEFVAVGRRYAASIRSTDAEEYTKIAREGNEPSRRVFRFSVANGMPECVFS